jgi:hypothetical protein
MNGILDPQIQGILSAAFNGLAASGPSRMPTSLGQIIGGAGQAGLNSYANAQNQAQVGSLRGLQIKQMQDEMTQKTLQRQQIESMLPTIPEADRAKFLINPGEYLKTTAYKPGDVLVQGGKPVTTIPQAPKIERVEIPTPEGGKRVGFVDMHAADPMATFREAGTENPSMQVGPAGQAYNPRALSPGTVLADPNKPFSVAPNGGVVPNQPFQDYSLNRAKAGASTVKVDMKQEGEEAKKVGQYFGDQYAEIQKAGFSAQGRINRINRMNELLNGVQTGKLTPAGTEAAAYLASLGVNIDKNLGNKQAAEALTNQMALELRNPAGGAGMPGAMSDSDRKFLVSMTPGLATTPEGRKLMNDTSVKIAKRDQDVARLAREYRKKNGQINEGFFEELQKFSEANPLFSDVAQKPEFKVLGVEKP